MDRPLKETVYSPDSELLSFGTLMCNMWSDLLAAHSATSTHAVLHSEETAPTASAPFLFGHFTIADAFFAPVCTRLQTYGLPVPPHIAAYITRVLSLPGVKAWTDAAMLEHDFRAFQEPYRLQR